MQNSHFTAAILTASDSCADGRREDESGRAMRDILTEAGYAVVRTALLPDDEDGLAGQLLEWCEHGGVDVIFTTGGTGFSPRDRMPEATMRVADRSVPGIAEAIRAHSMGITKRAMFSRAVSAICRGTLIINLPGSPKAVRESLEFLLPHLGHGLDVLRGGVQDCAADRQAQPGPPTKE